MVSPKIEPKLFRRDRKERKQQSAVSLPPEVLRGVGEVAVRAALLDIEIGDFAVMMLQPCPDGLTQEVRKLTIPRQLDLIESYLHEALGSPWRHEIKAFVKKVYAARNDRNDLVHRIWVNTDDPNIKTLIEVNAGRTEFKIRRSLDAAFLAELSERLDDLRLDFYDWFDERLTALAKRGLKAADRTEAIRSMLEKDNE